MFDDLIQKYAAPGGTPPASQGSGMFGDLIQKYATPQGGGPGSFGYDPSQAFQQPMTEAPATLGDRLPMVAGAAPHAMPASSVQGGPTPPAAPAPDVGKSLLDQFTNEQSGAVQGTLPSTRDVWTGKFSHGDPVGELSQFDFGDGYYDKSGNLLAVNPQKQVVLHDPVTDKMLVFNRTPDTEEGPLLSAGRLILPGVMGDAPGVKLNPSAAAAPEMSRAQKVISAFDRTGVPPSAPAVYDNAGISAAAHMANFSIMGRPISEGVANQVQATANQVEKVAAALGDIGDPVVAGEKLQAGAQNFRNVVIPAKENDLYSAARELIPPDQVSNLPATQAALANINGAVDNPALRDFVTDKNFQKLNDVIQSAADSGVSFDDLRQLRTQVRTLRPAEGSAVGINKTAVNQIYSGLTQDMLSMAMAGGPQAVGAIKRADQYTRAAAGSRIPTLDSVIGDQSGNKLYGDVLRLASTGVGGDWRKLAAVRRSVDQPTWDNMTATVIRTLGRPTPGSVTSADAPQAHFSPSTFMTNYERMSPRGRDVIFGGPGRGDLRQSLDDLATVNGELKRVQTMGNPSGTGRINTAIGLGWGMLFHPGATIGGAAAVNGFSKAMMSPRLVKWWAGMGRLEKQRMLQPSSPAISKAWQRQMLALPLIAGRDQDVAEFLRQVMSQSPISVPAAAPGSQQQPNQQYAQ